MCITPDGTRMYFGSTRPVNGIEQKEYKIWYVVDRVGDGWSQAKYLEAPINNGRRALYPSVSNNGTMFFQAVRDDSFGSRDIYYSKHDESGFTEPIHLGCEINSEYSEGDVLIAPDGKYFFFTSKRSGNGDLYWVDAKIIDDLQKEAKSD